MSHIEPNRSPKDAARRLGRGLSKIYELLREGKLKAKKDGKSTIILGSSIVEFEQNLPDYVPPGRKVTDTKAAA